MSDDAYLAATNSRTLTHLLVALVHLTLDCGCITVGQKATVVVALRDMLERLEQRKGDDHADE